LPISLEQACRDFNRHEFWGLISGRVVHGKFAPRCNDIQNLTLRLMHKWLDITLFRRNDVRPVRNNELMILYAMVNKIKISPWRPWSNNFLGISRSRILLSALLWLLASLRAWGS
jgi:hypothetical protein